ncbi:MAG TPA: Rieske (2Fe-2S) protein [Gemmatimonadales bacterium]|jgi:nitrite reductase/ring-hydroxylating ferredoxin subunit
MKDCRDCPLIERRTFVRDISVALAGFALALPIRMGRADSRIGDELTYPIPAEDGATIDHDNDVIVARYRQKLYAFNLSCPHQHTALHWEAEDQQFQCPRHHSRYTPDGVYVSGRATRSMDRFGVRRDGGNVIVDLAKYYREDQDHSDWDAALLAL